MNQPAHADFRPYLESTRTQLITQLALVASELANSYIMFASTQEQEKSARVQAFVQSQATSISGKERDAEVHSLHLSLGLIEMTGQIKALVEERDLLLFLLGEGNARTDRPVADDQGFSTGDQG